MPPKVANPYQAGPPVGRRSSFVGRQDLIRDALSVLERPEGRALVLYGQRRIGKTSILHQLEDGLRKTGRYLPVFVDMQEYADGKSVSLFADLAQRIARAAEIEEPTTIGNSPDKFYTWLRGILPRLGRGLVLLFDEFDVLAVPATTKTNEQRSSLFPDLRTVLERLQPQVGCLFVIGRNINDLSATALSLFKGTEARQVSLLYREDFRALLSLSRALLQWTPEAEESVWQLTNGHPLLSQMVASKLWERGEPVTPAVVAAVLPKVLEASGNSLKWLWEGLGPAPRVVASALASLGRAFTASTRSMTRS